MSQASTVPGRPVVIRCPTCGTINRVDLARLHERPRCPKCRAALTLDRSLPVTDGDFDRVIKGAAVPVLVDFHADWCGPCHAMAPTLESFAASQAGHVLTLKLDTDANPMTAQRFTIRGIPTLIAFRGGQEIRRHVGVADRQTLERLVS